MTYSLSNNCTKNYYNRRLTVQVIVEDVVTWIFLRHSVVPLPRRLCFHRRLFLSLFVSRIMQKLFNRFLQNLMKRWSGSQYVRVMAVLHHSHEAVLQLGCGQVVPCNTGCRLPGIQ